MFIELADHLRCPAAHDEAFLVLLPDRMDDRSVRAGQLGCPVCGRAFEIRDGVFDAGGEAPPASEEDRLTADAIVALTGLRGAGGYLVLIGSAADYWQEISSALPGVGLVAVNPGPTIEDGGRLSVLRGGMIPLKANSVRGVVLGGGYGAQAHWIAEAARATLPGLRVVGVGPDPPSELVDLMASADDVWVGSKARQRVPHS